MIYAGPPTKCSQEDLKVNLKSRDGEGQLEILEYCWVQHAKRADLLRLVSDLQIDGSSVSLEESGFCHD